MPDYEEKTFEFTVRELSFGDRVYKRLNESEPGLMVENVEPAGWASLAGLRQGDLILRINGSSMSEVKDLKKIWTVGLKKRENELSFLLKEESIPCFSNLNPIGIIPKQKDTENHENNFHSIIIDFLL